MADTAAHLVDRVFPEIPIRQGVLSLPFALRYRLAYDAHLVRDVLHIFVQAVFGSLRSRAGFLTSNRKARCGAVRFVQRFGDALNLNVHFHILTLDGIYAEDQMGCIRFDKAAPPSDAEVARVTERVQRCIAKLLERRGLEPQADCDDSHTLRNSQPLLAELYGASISGRVATGPRAGRWIAKVGDAIDSEDIASPPARVAGGAAAGVLVSAGKVGVASRCDVSLVPWFAPGTASGLLTAWVESTMIGAQAQNISSA